MKVTHDLSKDGALKIVQDTDLNSYTFDSILLSNFTTINKRTTRVVDLCSGNAPIAMLLTRKKINPDFSVVCVEYQKQVADLGCESIKLNQLEDSVSMINADLIDISKEIGCNYYHLITCNPPYFHYDPTSNIKGTKEVAIARHEILVNFEQIVVEAKKLLDNIGVFSFVHRPERLDELIITLHKHGFMIKRMQLVYPKIGSPANTVLIEAKKGQAISKMKILEPIFIYDEFNNYTKQALDIINQ